jgi:hypothetical protein
LNHTAHKGDAAQLSRGGPKATAHVEVHGRQQGLVHTLCDPGQSYEQYGEQAVVVDQVLVAGLNKSRAGHGMYQCSMGESGRFVYIRYVQHR